GIKDASLHIQTAQNAEFTLDGIKMFRSSNTVTDLGVGMTLTLNKTGEINFDVQQDFEGVTKAMQDLVDAYN
ncbi:flagellar filament capping protein FliD, partial [Campylobacter jejuni]|nr:flagellar filament capping protein FliD [Campylobacter jejuni]